MAKKEEKVLFQSENSVEVTGTLVSFEFKEILTQQDKIPMKMGNVRVKVAEGEEHIFNMMAMKYYKSELEKPEKNRKVNPAYKAIVTIESDHITEEHTTDENSEHFGKTPFVVSVVGSIEPNVFKTKKGEKVEGLGLQARFVNRVKDATDVEFGATVVLSGFVEKEPMEENGKDGEPTGRYLFTIRAIDYQNKAVPVEFIAGVVEDDDGNEIDAGEWIANEYSKGQTVTVGADIINRYIVKKVKRSGGGIGKTMVENKRDVKRERTIYAAQDPLSYHDFDEDSVLDRKQVVFPEQMGEAIKNYEQYVVEQFARADKNAGDGENKKKAKRGAMGGGTKKAAAPKAAAQESKIDEDDLPF